MNSNIARPEVTDSAVGPNPATDNHSVVLFQAAYEGPMPAPRVTTGDKPQSDLDRLLHQAEQSGHPITDPIDRNLVGGQRPDQAQLPGESRTRTTPDQYHPSNQQIADDWDAAFKNRTTDGPKAFEKVNAELSAAASDANRTGGAAGLSKFEEDLNTKIKADGAGPVFELKDGKITIHNMQNDATNHTVDGVAGTVQGSDIAPPVVIDAPQRSSSLSIEQHGRNFAELLAKMRAMQTRFS